MAKIRSAAIYNRTEAINFQEGKLYDENSIEKNTRGFYGTGTDLRGRGMLIHRRLFGSVRGEFGNQNLFHRHYSVCNAPVA